MTKLHGAAIAAALAAAFAAAPAQADAFGTPIKIGEGVTLDPIVEALLRYEHVDQTNIADTADAVTLRVRAGGELKSGEFSLLAEGEGTLALVDDYNDTIPGNGVEPFPIVSDPENIEINRLQVGWMKDGSGITVGRQRIQLDNQRFVGNVGWRQNEQTFDAVRGQLKLGKLKFDATYAISQRTLFGYRSPNEHFDGDIVLLNAGADLNEIKLTGFAYLIDYDTRIAFSSQTYGGRATGAFKLGDGLTAEFTASIATQSDLGANPTSYQAEYFNLEAGAAIKDLTLKGGYEELGSDGGVASFQTPLATLHAFNGWADLFLTTPAVGLRDFYLTAAYRFTKVKQLPGLNLQFAYHKYENDTAGADMGNEWNASLGFRVGKVNLLAKYADYDASGFGSDTQKFWLQAAVSY
jgi:hypothetical protein